MAVQSVTFNQVVLLFTVWQLRCPKAFKDQKYDVWRQGNTKLIRDAFFYQFMVRIIKLYITLPYQCRYLGLKTTDILYF